MPEYYESTPIAADQALENKLVNKALSNLPTPYLTGLKLREDVTLNGLVMNSIEDPTNENGYAAPVIWVVTDIEGWWETPDPEIPDLQRGWGDGSYDAKGRYNSRVISLSGSILVQSPEDSVKARDRLIRATTLVHTGGWLTVDESPTKAAYVRLSGKVNISSKNPRGRLDFSIGLKAADPLKYEWIDGNEDGYDYVDISSHASNTTTITNSGNIAVPVVFEIRNGLTSVDADDPAIIYNETNDSTIEIIGTLESSQTLEIDTYNREVLLISSAGAITNGRPKAETLLDWIYLEPGDNEIQFYDSANPTSTAVCRVYWRSGWIG
jgi:hypothetical protein